MSNLATTAGARSLERLMAHHADDCKRYAAGLCSSRGFMSSESTRTTCSAADTEVESVADSVATVYLSEDVSAHKPFVDCFFRLAAVRKEESLVAVVWRCTVLLKRCGFPDDDVCSVLAHASAYVATVAAAAGATTMRETELRNLLLVCIYSAHGFVLDSECPLRVWKQFAMDQSVSLRSLNMAIVHLMKVRGYRMRVSDASLSDRYSRLLAAASAH